MGFSYSKPRPIPWHLLKSNKNSKRIQTGDYTHGLGYTIFAADEAGILKGSVAGYGWRPKDGCNTIQIKDTKSVKIFGALRQTKFTCDLDTLGSDSFIDFLKKMSKFTAGSSLSRGAVNSAEGSCISALSACNT